MNAEFAEMVQVLLVFGSILTDRFVTQNYHDIFGLGAWGEQVGVEVEVVFEGGVHVEMGNGGCTACFGGVGPEGGRSGRELPRLRHRRGCLRRHLRHRMSPQACHRRAPPFW